VSRTFTHHIAKVRTGSSGYDRSCNRVIKTETTDKQGASAGFLLWVVTSGDTWFLMQNRCSTDVVGDHPLHSACLHVS